jgi:hypothetical protein
MKLAARIAGMAAARMRVKQLPVLRRNMNFPDMMISIDWFVWFQTISTPARHFASSRCSKGIIRAVGYSTTLILKLVNVRRLPSP